MSNLSHQNALKLHRVADPKVGYTIQRLFDFLTGIQHGSVIDPFGWTERPYPLA